MREIEQPLSVPKDCHQLLRCNTGKAQKVRAQLTHGVQQPAPLEEAQNEPRFKQRRQPHRWTVGRHYSDYPDDKLRKRFVLTLAFADFRSKTFQRFQR